MLQTDKLIDSYDEDMRSYFESDTYKYRHKTNNKKIEASGYFVGKIPACGYN